MSLLHEALKKAEKTGMHSGSGGVFVDGEGSSPKKTDPRLYLLIAVALAGLLIAVYFQFVRPRPVSSVTAGSSPPTPLGIAGGPDLPTLHREAEDLLKLGQWKKARGLLEKLVILEPQNSESYNNLGLALKKSGHKEEAYEQYKKALALRPDYPEAINNLGVLYLADRRFDEAKGQFQHLVRIRPDYPEAYFHIGMIEEASGRNEEARRNYRKFLELAQNLEGQFVTEIKNRIKTLEATSG